MTPPLAPRSALYMPASNARAIAKASGLGCDSVILDLEDAVAPEHKIAAREAACAAVREGSLKPRLTVIRVNGLDTPWGADDLAAAVAAAPDAVLAPKVSSPAALKAYEAALASAPASVRLWIMVETARAVVEAPAMAAASAGRLTTLVVGPNDLCIDLCCRSDAGRGPLLYALSATVAAARAFGLSPLDGVFNALDDPEGLGAECREGRALGFDGKTLIHPSQIEAANRAFSPDPEAIAFARAVVAAFTDPANADRGAIRLQGRMVERLHLAEAERLLARAERL